MRIAVVQHKLRGNAHDDAAALADSAARAARGGAELVVLPEVFSAHSGGDEARKDLTARLESVSACCITAHAQRAPSGSGVVLALPSDPALPDDIGTLTLLDGDACIDEAELARAAEEKPAMAVLMPRSENDLQAEAVLELAIALSSSLAGLVVVADCVGAEPSEVGHGGSAIILLGDVLAEAVADEDVLWADVLLPIPQPEPREPLPAIPPLLLQRLAYHHGRKLEVTAYPADVT